MKVTVVCVGKLKEKYWRDAIAEYSKRLSRYMKLEIIELADEKAPENMSDAQAAEVKEREGQRILKNVKDDAFAVALAVEEKKRYSEELAEFMAKKSVGGVSHIVFIIPAMPRVAISSVSMALSLCRLVLPYRLIIVPSNKSLFPEISCSSSG